LRSIVVVGVRLGVFMSHAKNAKPPRRMQTKKQADQEPKGSKRNTISWRLGVLGVRKDFAS
jgi:hypothetical protein